MQVFASSVTQATGIRDAQLMLLATESLRIKIITFLLLFT